MADRTVVRVRLSTAALARVDALAEIAGEESNRSVVLRACLARGLPLVEREHGVTSDRPTLAPVAHELESGPMEDWA